MPSRERRAKALGVSVDALPPHAGIVDKTGQRFGILTVRSLEFTKDRRTYWRCDCDCGGTRVVRANDLTGARVKSCGCLNRIRGGLSRKKIVKPQPIIVPKYKGEPDPTNKPPMRAIFYNPPDRRAGR